MKQTTIELYSRQTIEVMSMVLRAMILPVGVCLAIILPFLIFGATIEDWTSTCVSGAAPTFLAALAFSTLALDGVLPVPSSLVSLAVAGALGAWFGAVVIWLGMTGGCAITWAVGRGLLGPVDRRIGGSRAAPNWSWVALVLLRPVPVLAEASVLMAAARGMGFVRLIALTALANLPLAVLYGYFGAYVLGEVPLIYLLAGVGAISCLAIGITLLWKRDTRCAC